MPGRRSPWYEEQPRVAAAVCAALFAAVVVTRLVVGGGANAVLLLYVFPVALAALTWGLRGGTVAAGIAVVGIVVPLLLDDDGIGVVGWVTRISAVVVLGVLLGQAQDRTRAHQRWLLAEEAARIGSDARARAAAEISDSLLQGMSSAKWMLEAGKVDAGIETLEETIERAQRIVSDLLDPP